MVCQSLLLNLCHYTSVFGETNTKRSMFVYDAGSSVFICIITSCWCATPVEWEDKPARPVLLVEPVQCNSDTCSRRITLTSISTSSTDKILSLDWAAVTSDLYSPALDVERADGEVDPDGVLLPLGELARLEALHQAGLAHVGVSDEDDLEEKVEGVLLRIHESVERSAGSHSSERERERALSPAAVLCAFSLATLQLSLSFPTRFNRCDCYLLSCIVGNVVQQTVANHWLNSSQYTWYI